MPFDATIRYAGPFAAGDELDANLANAFMTQRGTFASRPLAGNQGVIYVASDGAGGVGGRDNWYYDDGATWIDLGSRPLFGPYNSEYILAAYIFG